jgi:hypothetical protein
MTSLSWWVLAIFRHWTGYRLYHLIASVLAVALALAALAVPFWWLGEAAASEAGALGVLAVVVAYLWAALLTLGAAAFILTRLVWGRLRRSFPFGAAAASR